MLLTGLLEKTGWDGGGGGAVGRRGDEATSKLKGARAKHALPCSYLHVSCLL